MDTEQLKMILDTLRTMGEAGQSAFIWWLVMDKALPVVGWLLTFVGIMWLSCRVMSKVSTERLGGQVRDMLGVGSPGVVTPNEARETLQRVRELMVKSGIDVQ